MLLIFFFKKQNNKKVKQQGQKGAAKRLQVTNPQPKERIKTKPKYKI